MKNNALRGRRYIIKFEVPKTKYRKLKIKKFKIRRCPYYRGVRKERLELPILVCEQKTKIS
jgi:hypothetical protein